jgi:hypothetical protein
LKTILFFTCEPGGAEVLIPVIKEMLKDNDFKIIVLGYGFAADRFKKNKINFKLIESIQQNDFLLFEQYKPDFIITSATSLPQKDMSEKYLWHNAKQQNIPTIAFLDQWQNYAIRFSGVSEDEYMMYQPDFINCINDIGKKVMQKLGFKSDKLIEFGQPYLSTLKDKSIEKAHLIEKLKLDDKKEVVLFVSEAIEEHFGTSRGYTQYETIDYLLSNHEFLGNKQIVVKLHPKDDINKFNKYQNIILIQNEFSAFEMIFISNYIIGMTSIMLIEAYILKKNVLSIQLNSNDDLLLLSNEKYINQITDKSYKISKNSFKQDGAFLYKFEYKVFKEFLLDEAIN